MSRAEVEDASVDVDRALGFETKHEDEAVVGAAFEIAPLEVVLFGAEEED